MIIRKAYRFRIKTTTELERQFSRYAGCARLVWNKMLERQNARLEGGERVESYSAMCAVLTAWKRQPELAFLNDVHSQVVQQRLKDLGRAFRDAFDPSQPDKEKPRFKKKLKDDSFRFPQGFKVDAGNTRVYLPKIGWVRYHRDRAHRFDPLKGVPRNVTVRREGLHWYLSIQVEQTLAEPAHPATSITGVDRGIARFITLADGSFVEPLNSFKKLEKKLAKLQRALAQKVKFSNNWKKLKAKLTRLHRTIAEARRDFLHKHSTMLCHNHAIIVLEDLQVKNMSASSKGTLDNPGRNVKAKSGLNKRILDQGWGEFERQVGYKQAWLGGELILVPAHFTSQRCPVCTYTDSENRKKQDTFHCQNCGHQAHADQIGALNILAAGHAVLACEAPHGVETVPNGTKRGSKTAGGRNPSQVESGILVL